MRCATLNCCVVEHTRGLFCFSPLPSLLLFFALSGNCAFVQILPNSLRYVFSIYCSGCRFPFCQGHLVCLSTTMCQSLTSVTCALSTTIPTRSARYEHLTSTLWRRGVDVRNVRIHLHQTRPTSRQRHPLWLQAAS